RRDVEWLSALRHHARNVGPERTAADWRAARAAVSLGIAERRGLQLADGADVGVAPQEHGQERRAGMARGEDICDPRSRIWCTVQRRHWRQVLVGRTGARRPAIFSR